MKKVLLSATLGLALVACGKDDSIAWKDPDSVNFTFGTPSDTLTADEQTAVNGGSAALAEAPAFVGETDQTTADGRGMNVANLPNQMQAAFGDDVETPALRALRQGEGAVTAQGLALLAGTAAVAGPVWDNPSCWTVTAAEIRYASCRRTTVQDGNELTVTLNGGIQREAGLVSWNVTLTGSAKGSGMTVTISDHLRGQVAFSTVDQTIVGKSRSDFHIQISGVGPSVEMAVTYSADYDLDYTTDPSFCITGGTLTAKRVWSLLPPGVDPSHIPAYADTGVQFTWQGCGLVQVAWPVP